VDPADDGDDVSETRRRGRLVERRVHPVGEVGVGWSIGVLRARAAQPIRLGIVIAGLGFHCQRRPLGGGEGVVQVRDLLHGRRSPDHPILVPPPEFEHSLGHLQPRQPVSRFHGPQRQHVDGPIQRNRRHREDARDDRPRLQFLDPSDQRHRLTVKTRRWNHFCLGEGG
jgi:hypothetical protein